MVKKDFSSKTTSFENQIDSLQNQVHNLELKIEEDEQSEKIHQSYEKSKYKTKYMTLKSN